MIGRNGVTRPWHWAPVQQRDCEGPCCRGSQSGTPPAQPRSLHHALEEMWCDCALALARADKNCAVSTLQRPPTSAASTTSVPDHLLRTAPGTWPPPFFSPSAVQLRRGWRPFLKLTRRAREVRPTSCQLPAVPLATSSSHLQPLPTSARPKR